MKMLMEEIKKKTELRNNEDKRILKTKRYICMFIKDSKKKKNFNERKKITIHNSRL